MSGCFSACMWTSNGCIASGNRSTCRCLKNSVKSGLLCDYIRWPDTDIFTLSSQAQLRFITIIRLFKSYEIEGRGGEIRKLYYYNRRSRASTTGTRVISKFTVVTRSALYPLHLCHRLSTPDSLGSLSFATLTPNAPSLQHCAKSQSSTGKSTIIFTD